MLTSTILLVMILKKITQTCSSPTADGIIEKEPFGLKFYRKSSDNKPVVMNDQASIELEHKRGND